MYDFSQSVNCIVTEETLLPGIYPLALVNYITLSGGGFDHVPGSGVRLKTMEELAEEV